jgi:hypothetical protein
VGAAESVVDTIGSERLAGLQRAAFEPMLAEALKEVAPELCQRLLALVAMNPEISKQQIDEVLEALSRRLEVPGSEHVRDEQLERLHERITEAARRLKVTPLDGVAIGTLHTRSVDAFSDRFFGAANIVAVHVPLMVFAYLIAKATATFPLASSPLDELAEGKPVVVPLQLYRLGLRWLTQLVFAVVVDRNPIGQPPYSPPRGWPFWPVALAWVDGIEFFCVAHEYGHLLHGQGEQATDELKAAGLLDGESTDDPITSELAADRFGLAASWVASDRAAGDRSQLGPIVGDHHLEAFGPLVFLWFLERVESVGHVMHGEGHPLAGDRLAQAERMFPSDEAAAMWVVMKRRLEAAWSIASRAAVPT